MATPYRPQNTRPKPAAFGPILPFILPLPLVFVVFKSLSAGRLLPFAASAIGLALYFLAGYFLRRAHHYEKAAQRRKWQRPTRVPWRFSATVFTAAATGLVAWFAAGHGLFISLGYAAVAFLGVLFLYGRDPHYQDHTEGLVGVTVDELVDALDEAEARIDAIETAAGRVKQAGVRDQLKRIAVKSREILRIIEEDPKDLRRARKFLKVYLQSAREVAENYASDDHLQESATIKGNLGDALDLIEDTIGQQKQKLLDDDILELDVQIEVLQTQLKHEGIR